jgi:teichuronic acid biosynthesis glycosyltransferase TuaC
MRVLFVIPGEAAGCSMIFARRLMESLMMQGVEVHAFFLRSRTSPVILIREWLRIRKDIARVRPSIVHAHFGSVTALFAALSAGRLPLVITYRGGDLNPAHGSLRQRVRSLLAHVLSQAAALRATKVVCVSRQLRQRLWWRRGRAVILPSGVDPTVFFPEPRGSVRRRLGWLEEQPVAVFNAGHDPQVKRLDLALQAVDAARQRVPELRLEVLDGRVEPSEVPARMNAADCLLVTSDSEGSPTVVQEALACGLPIVSVEVGDVVERLTGVEHTRVVERSACALGEALADLASEPRRTDGRSKIGEFATPVIAARLRLLYEELAAQNGGADPLVCAAPPGPAQTIG